MSLVRQGGWLAALILLSMAAPINAGEIVVNNLSNDTVWVILHVDVIMGKDSQIAESNELKVDDKRTLKFPGDFVWVRISKGGVPQKINNAPQEQRLYCDEGPFTIHTSEDPRIRTLKWRAPNGEIITKHWRRGDPLPAGWSEQTYSRVASGRRFEATP